MADNHFDMWLLYGYPLIRLTGYPVVGPFFAVITTRGQTTSTSGVTMASPGATCAFVPWHCASVPGTRTRSSAKFGSLAPLVSDLKFNSSDPAAGWWFEPLWENMKVNGKDDIPYIMENKTCSKPPAAACMSKSLSRPSYSKMRWCDPNISVSSSDVPHAPGGDVSHLVFGLCPAKRS